MTVAVFGIVLGFLALGADQSASEAQDAHGNAASEILVYRVRSTPPQDLAEALLNVFDLDLAAEPHSEALVIRLDSQIRPKVLAVLEQLDRPARMLLVQTLLLKPRGERSEGLNTESLTGPADKVASAIRELEQQGKLYVAHRMEVTAVENQRAMLQVGETVPLVSGTTIAGPRERVNSYRDHQIGTVLSVLARASDDGGIAMALQFEKSDVQPTPQPVGDAAPGPQGTATLSQHTTVHVRDGHAVLAGRLLENSERRTQEAFLVVSARILDQPGEGITFRSVSRSDPDPAPSALDRRTRGRSDANPFGFGGGRPFPPPRPNEGDAADRNP